jgi:hypothetical protein
VKHEISQYLDTALTLLDIIRLDNSVQKLLDQTTFQLSLKGFGVLHCPLLCSMPKNAVTTAVW